MICVALDLGQNMGWAAGDLRGHPEFSSEPMGTSSEKQGARFYQALLFTRRLIAAYNPALIVMESAIASGPAGAAARAQMAMGYRAAVLTAAFMDDVTTEECAVNSVRKHFIGTGGLGGAKAKHQTIEACLARGWPVDDHNEADALAVWDYAGHKHGIRKSMPVGGLFEDLSEERQAK